MAGTGGLDARLQQEVVEIVSGLRDWRAQHPRATFAEMEQVVDERFNAARARVVQGGHAVRLERDDALCPSCGTGLFPPG